VVTTREFLGFDVGGSSPEQDRLAFCIAAVAGEIAITLKMQGSTSEEDLRVDPLVLTTALAAVSFLHNTGRLTDSDLSTGGVDDTIMFDEIIDETIARYNTDRVREQKVARHAARFENIFDVPVGSTFGYPTAPRIGAIKHDLGMRDAEAELRTEFPDKSDDEIRHLMDWSVGIHGGTDDEIRAYEIRSEHTHPGYHGAHEENAERTNIHAKIAGWLQYMAHGGEIDVVEVPSTDLPTEEMMNAMYELSRKVNLKPRRVSTPQEAAV